MELRNEEVPMGRRAIDRFKVIQKVLEHRLNKRQAAQQLGLGRRQVIRLCQRVEQEGATGVVHRLRGQPSNHRLKAGVLDQAMALLKDPLYAGFGPTFACEKLAEQKIMLSVSTLRQGMVAAGLWKGHKPKARHRTWRERRACVGELVQLDGSDHDWFEGRGPRCVLLLYIDDATSRILYARFVDVEDTLTLFQYTRAYLKKHGRPIAFYVDKDSIYRVNRQANLDESLKDLYPMTQYKRAMNDLGIDVICADSPQAKGRVERSFNTHQDRLVKELRLAGISSQEAGHHFLTDVYIPAHNAKFAVAPRNTTDAHRRMAPEHRLHEILSFRTPRVVGNDYTLRFQNHYFQILKEQRVVVRPKHSVDIEIRLDRTTHLRFKKTYLNFKSITKKPNPQEDTVGKELQTWLKRVPHKPKANHPWRRYGYKSQRRAMAYA